jgi:hypothetical protein
LRQRRVVISGAMEPPYETPESKPTPIDPRPSPMRFPLGRDSFTVSSLMSRASDAWGRDLGNWVLALLLYLIIGFGVPGVLRFVWGIFGSIQEPSSTFSAVNIIAQAVMQILQLVLTGIFTLGLWAMAVRGLHGERATVGVLFSQVSKVWKYVAQSIAITVGVFLLVAPIILLVFLAFIGPVDRSTPLDEIVEKAAGPFGIAMLIALPAYAYVVAGLAFMQIELAFNDDAGPIEAILISWRIARGKRLVTIGVGILSIFIYLGSLMLCFIGVLFGGPVAMLLFAALYLALRNGADVPPANTASTLGTR